MQNSARNVLFINKTVDINEIIASFLKKYALRSQNTVKNYEKHLELYFRVMRQGKSIDQLTYDDLNIKRVDVRTFQSRLVDLGYLPSSVNVYVDTVKSFYEELTAMNEEEELGLSISRTAFNIDRLKDPDKKSRARGVFHWDEVLKLMEEVKSKRKGLMHSILFELASITSFRYDALTKLKLSNFKKINNEVYSVEVIDKGQKYDSKSIHTDFYERIVAMHNEMCATDSEYAENGFLFDTTLKTANNHIHAICETLGIDDKGRNLSFHSFKKCGMNEVYRLTNKDLRLTQQQGNHSSANTAIEMYLEDEKDPLKNPSLLIGKQIDLSGFFSLPKEDMIRVIESLPRNVLIEIENNFKCMNKNVL
jgi:site-specific recombinase XerD